MSGLRERFLASVGARTGGPFPLSGYYHFLGEGDYGAGHPLTGWGLAEWERWLDRLKADGHSRIWLLVNGYTLAYPTGAYPELRDPDSASVRDPALIPAIVAAAHARGIRAHAAFATDGHAKGFARLHPEARAVDREGAPVGDVELCLDEPATAAYVRTQLEEVAALTPDWDGIVLHPTESAPLAFNAATRDRYRAETGGDLAVRTDEELLPWFNDRYARAAGEWLTWWATRFPGSDLVVFNCWWMDAHAALHARRLPLATRVCVWDYDYRCARWRDRSLLKWSAAMKLARLLVMPSGGGYPEHGRPPTDEALRGYDRFLTLAAHLGVGEAVFFAGWGAGDETEVRLDRALLSGCAGALASPDEALLDALDADYDGVRARLGGGG